MSRIVEIVAGDFGQQTAEFISEGVMQRPSLSLDVYFLKKGLLGTRKRWEHVIWPIKEYVSKVELLEELPGEGEETEWVLPGVKAKRKAASKTPKVGEKVSRKSKRVRFQIRFTDGRTVTAIADARIFQNMFAMTS